MSCLTNAELSTFPRLHRKIIFFQGSQTGTDYLPLTNNLFQHLPGILAGILNTGVYARRTVS